MKISDVFHKMLVSLNGADRKPIYETYDKNVQGNTVHERGKVSAGICTPFRNFEELSGSRSKTGVAIASGGNPSLAQVSAKEASKSAIAECVISVSCVGGTPLCATDCLNFGNPEKKEQMGQFVDGVAGIKEVCETLEVPIVSGNVSFYNESGQGAIPPSSLVSVFARVNNPKTVPQLSFEKEGLFVFYVGQRSENLGGSEFLSVNEKKDTRIPLVDLEAIKKWTPKLKKLAEQNKISTAHPISGGGLLMTLAKSCFENEIGVDIEIPKEWTNKVLPFLFSEDLGVLIATTNPEEIQKTFGSDCVFLGRTKNVFNLSIKNEKEMILNEDLKERKKEWMGGLRGIF